MGTIFHFDLKDNRSELELHDALKDKIADSNDDLKDVIFAEELDGVTDIDEGPDGNVYILSNYLEQSFNIQDFCRFSTFLYYYQLGI